jgi:uncharacterized membrane protein
MAFLVFILIKKTKLEIPSSSIPLFLFVAVIAVAYNYFSVSAIASAPNPGYVEAINSFRVIVILVASSFFFDASITPKKLVGIILATTGLILVSL